MSDPATMFDMGALMNLLDTKRDDADDDSDEEAGGGGGRGGGAKLGPGNIGPAKKSATEPKQRYVRLLHHTDRRIQSVPQSVC